ncbi:MAG: undecaprenyl-diphosphate phosphatase [Candidatus Omnitrophica bacterium]|nr:undecaprenyl-diphosphate phosphatase [Candidatus Omnitrophota bacterium]
MKFFFFGIAQGLTEFLPISSSGHLYLLKKLFGTNENLLAQFIMLHMATLFALLIFFWQQIIALFFEKKRLLHLLLVTIITGIGALFIKHFFEKFFDHKVLLSSCFLINAIILLSTPKVALGRNIDEMRAKDSFILGMLQALAVFPGISRSGITISGLLRRGFKPREAFQISFLMAIPAIIGAFILEFKELSVTHMAASSIAAGCVSAFGVGILSLLIVKKTLVSAHFNVFGYYCLLIFIVSLFL